MTVCCWVVVWRTIAEWLLEQVHVNWLPSVKVTVAFRTQTWSSTMVCGVSVSCQLPSVQPWMVVKVWLVVVVPLPCGTPFWKFCVTIVVMSCSISACCLGFVQPQPVEPPMFGKFAVLVPWQTTCSDLVPCGVTVVLVEPVPSRVVVRVRSTNTLPLRVFGVGSRLPTFLLPSVNGGFDDEPFQKPSVVSSV